MSEESPSNGPTKYGDPLPPAADVRPQPGRHRRRVGRQQPTGERPYAKNAATLGFGGIIVTLLVPFAKVIFVTSSKGDNTTTLGVTWAVTIAAIVCGLGGVIFGGMALAKKMPNRAFASVGIITGLLVCAWWIYVFYVGATVPK